MKYMVLGDDGREYGPIDAETLRKWVKSGRVLPHTQVRNALLKNKWGDAAKLDFLGDAFVVLSDRRHQEAGWFERLCESFSQAGKEQDQGGGEVKKNTAFRHAYAPQPASLVLRGLALLTDLLVLALAAIILLFVFGMAVKAEIGRAHV